MSSDWYFTEAGDIRAAANGDIELTNSPWRDDSQQAYIRVLTEPGDFMLYKSLGAEMSSLFGMAQTQATGKYGESLIKAALDREGRFVGRTVTVTGVPTGPQTIRFDVYVQSGSRNALILSVEQELGLTYEEPVLTPAPEE